MDKLPNISDVLKNTLFSIIGQFQNMVPRVLGCIFFLIIGFIVARIAKLVISKVLEKIGLD